MASPPNSHNLSTSLPNPNSSIRLLTTNEAPINATATTTPLIIPTSPSSSPKRPLKMPNSPSSPLREGAALGEYQAQMRQWHNRIGKRYRNRLSDQFESLQAALRISRDTDPAEFRRVQQQAAVVAAAAAALSHSDDDSDGGGEGGEGGDDDEHDDNYNDDAEKEGQGEGKRKGDESKSGGKDQGNDQDKDQKDKHVKVHGRTMNKARVLDMARERIEELTRERERLMREREMLLAGMQGSLSVVTDG